MSRTAPSDIPPRWWEPWAAAAIGLAVYLSLRGGKTLSPGYLDWLRENDPVTHQLGWQFFRHSPWLQWPLGANTGYGLELGSSIVFSDSIPLLAMVFKLLGPVLPQSFQYFGLWLAVCFSLQAFFGWKLLRRFTDDWLLALLGCAFFAVAPVLLFRLKEGHLALVAQWLVLAALWLYFAPRLAKRGWLVLLLLGVWIHAYLLVMVWLVWVADLVRRYLLREHTWGALSGHFIACNLAIVLSMWAAGYFMLGSSVGAGGFGFYRTNLLALIDPDQLWSRLLRAQPRGVGDYEGFAYPGVGMLLLCVIAGVELMRKRWQYERPGLAPLLVATVFLAVFAVSHRIGFGRSDLLVYPVPAVVQPIINALRVSGRFIWPMYYLLFLGVLCVVFTRVPRRAAAVLCAGLLVVQLADSANGWSFLRARLGKMPVWSSPMRDMAWDGLAGRYTKLILVRPGEASPNWMPIAEFAATHRMAVNTGYFARMRADVVAGLRERYVGLVERNEFSADSLYIFEDERLWGIALSQLRPGDLAGSLDGFHIVAPGLRRCAECAFIARIAQERR